MAVCFLLVSFVSFMNLLDGVDGSIDLRWSCLVESFQDVNQSLWRLASWCCLVAERLFGRGFHSDSGSSQLGLALLLVTAAVRASLSARLLPSMSA